MAWPHGSVVRGFRAIDARRLALGFAAVLTAITVVFSPAPATALGRIQGRIVGADTGEPIGYADLMLIPADTTMKRVGGLTNADGTYLLEAPAGAYALQVRALSYERKRIEGLVLTEGQLLEFSTTIAPAAIQQKEIVVEATAKRNTEASMLAVRKKASSLGDAVSSEQMRRAPDKNAGEVLRRVTGLSVTDGKYVFVRGLGERYSSTELDGVRIASPEKNKRVVPMDLFPAALLDNIIVQKTYTADRSGEFGGGDVQIQTKYFPGKRLWSFSVSQGYEAGSTFKTRQTYRSSSADIWGFGAQSRGIPPIVNEIAGNRPLVEGSGLGFPASTLRAVEKQFANVWTPTGTRTIPNGSYSLTYGDQFQVLGRPLGVVQAWSFSRSFDRRDETFRLPNTAAGQTVVLKDDYTVQRFTESAQLGGNASLSYRISPSSQLHLYGFYTNSADDEVRKYQGLDNDGDPFYLRSTRLMYLQRDILSGSVEGQQEFPAFLKSNLDWKVTRSSARNQQPDRRESTYQRIPIDPSDPNSGYWGLVVGRREYGDLKDDNWGTTLKSSVPYRLARLGNGKLTVGYDRQTKRRQNYYRRFDFIPAQFGSDAPPESVFDKVNESTLPQDNYFASQKVQALFLSADVPLGSRLRSNFGLRHEEGRQEVVSHDLFNPARVTSEGKLVNTDWLAGANVVWSFIDDVNLRAAASRTLSRPDLDELSPRPTLDYIGDYQRLGNPRLKRAIIENYDLRFEAFPTASEVVATGIFLKELHDPIENTVRGASSGFVLIPENSASGRNIGVEFEFRASLGRLAPALKNLSLNSNLSLISSRVKLKDSPTKIGSQNHPLQGQANHLINAALTYQSPRGGLEASVLVTTVGSRLVSLSNASQGIPDHYDPGTTSLDATLGFAPFKGGRFRFGAGNLLDQRVREMIGTFEARAYRTGRSFSASLSYGS
jgi:outer membrane receptor protein involved in Fe transport